MPEKSKRQRAIEQRSRQQKAREKARADRRPSRDDIARMFFWQTISQAQQSGEAGRNLIRKMADLIVSGLEDQGFDDQESYEVFDELVRRYHRIFPFRPKRHLDPDKRDRP